MLEKFKKWFTGTNRPKTEMCPTGQRMDLSGAEGLATATTSLEVLRQLFPIPPARRELSAKERARRARARKSAKQARRITRRNQK